MDAETAITLETIVFDNIMRQRKGTPAPHHRWFKMAIIASFWGVRFNLGAVCF